MTFKTRGEKCPHRISIIDIISEVTSNLKIRYKNFFDPKNFSRERIYNPEIIIGGLISLLKNHNQNGYQITLNQFFSELAKHDCKFENIQPTASSFSKARKKLPFEVIEQIALDVAKK